MAYNDHAVSNQNLIEVVLYEYNIGTTYHRVTNADRIITYEGEDYEPVAISDNGIKGADAGERFKVTLDVTLPPHQYFVGIPPSEEMWLTVRRLQFGDTVAAIYWVGTIDSSKQVSEATAEMTGRLMGRSLKRTGLRGLWSRGCSKMLYATECGVNKADFATPATVTALTPTTITAAEITALTPGWFDGGFVEWVRPDGSMDRRMIMAGGTSDTITVSPATTGLAVLDNITLYAGCDLTWEGGCTKLGNTDNYGGVRCLIEKSPFDGTRII